jgi:hypothetical protein
MHRIGVLILGLMIGLMPSSSTCIGFDARWIVYLSRLAFQCLPTAVADHLGRVEVSRLLPFFVRSSPLASSTEEFSRLRTLVLLKGAARSENVQIHPKWRAALITGRHRRHRDRQPRTGYLISVVIAMSRMHINFLKHTSSSSPSLCSSLRPTTKRFQTA